MINFIKNYFLHRQRIFLESNSYITCINNKSRVLFHIQTQMLKRLMTVYKRKRKKNFWFFKPIQFVVHGQ